MRLTIFLLLCFFSIQTFSQNTFQTVKFLDSLEQTLKIKVGMGAKDFEAANREIAKELFKSSKTVISKGGTRRTHKSSKVPSVLTLIFDNDRLTSYAVRIPCNNQEDGTTLYKKYRDLIKAKVGSGNIMYDKPTYVEVKHPTARWYYLIMYDPKYQKDANCGLDIHIDKRDDFDN